MVGVEVAAVFLGTHTLRMDEKGRVALPAKFRERLADGLVITRGQENCVSVFPLAEFTRRSVALSQVPNTAPRVRDYARLLYSAADAPTPDKQGRIVINLELRRYAALERDCVAIGSNTHFEIWDGEAWRRFLDEHEPLFARMDSEVVPGLV
ncbi:division/cell wall cluster transcriptional repressor MraZ [soil metagenome]